MRPPHQRARALTERVIALAAGIAALAMLFDLFVGWDASDVERRPAAAPRGYFAIDATMTEMGEDGRPRFVVHASEIEQDLADQSIRFEDVTLDYQAKDLGNWHLTAMNGSMPEDRKSLFLEGAVTITGAAEQGGAVIRTDKVDYDIDDGVVQTAEPVSIRVGKHDLNASGLRAMLNAGTLRLESDVNGRFIP
jgi:LPS export ABC transporter protein LptC